jgi:hypothetical protein
MGRRIPSAIHKRNELSAAVIEDAKGERRKGKEILVDLPVPRREFGVIVNAYR